MGVFSDSCLALHLAAATILLRDASEGFLYMLSASIPSSFLATITCNSCAHLLFLSSKKLYDQVIIYPLGYTSSSQNSASPPL